jgi:hypothetical protein
LFLGRLKGNEIQEANPEAPASTEHDEILFLERGFVSHYSQVSCNSSLFVSPWFLVPPLSLPFLPLPGQSVVTLLNPRHLSLLPYRFFLFVLQIVDIGC